MQVYKEKRMKFTAVFMAVPEGYIGFVEELPGGQYKKTIEPHF